MKKTLISMTFAASIAVLFGCSTQARKDVMAQCQQDGVRLHPPIIEEKLVQRIRAIQVPSGQINCTSSSYGSSATTNCTTIKQTEFIPYTAIQKIDLNKKLRDDYVINCSDSICMLNYKNKECK